MKTIKTICQSMAGLAASAVLALGVAESASAHTLIFDESDPNLVTGIEGLDIAGTEYDVRFVFGSFNDVFGNTGDLSVLEGNTPAFWLDEVGADEAADAIATALGDMYGTTSVSTFDYVGLVDGFVVPFGVLNLDLWVVEYSMDLIAYPDDDFVEEYWFQLDIPLSSDPWACDQYELGEGGDKLDCPWAVFFGDVVDEEDGRTVPEPTSTIAILAVAGTGLLATRKRKK
ncbi:MAG: PEP-CTERM sorting domain-containing protein [Cyanobacteria bacterium P01_E01_bin.42]